jgi:hypothetical protein
VEPCQTSGPSDLDCVEGKKSPREEPDHYDEPARFNQVKLWRKAKLGKVGFEVFRHLEFNAGNGKPQS